MANLFLWILILISFAPTSMAKSWKEISKKKLEPRMSFSGTGVLNRARRDIFNLNYNGPISKTILDTYTPEEIGFGLVYRIQHKCSNVKWNKNISRREKDDIPGSISVFFKNIFSKKGKSRYEQPKYDQKKEFIYLNRPSGLVVMELASSFIEKMNSLERFNELNQEGLKDPDYLNYLKKLTCLNFSKSAKRGKKSNLDQISPSFTGRAKLIYNNQNFNADYIFIYKNDVIPRSTFHFGAYRGAWKTARSKGWRGINFDYPSIHHINWKKHANQGLGANVFGINLINDISYIITKQKPSLKTMKLLRQFKVPIIQLPNNIFRPAKVGEGLVLYTGDKEEYRAKEKWKKVTHETVLPSLSFSNVGRLNKVRKKVLNIPINGNIPESILKNYNSKEIGTAISHRVKYKCLPNYYSKPKAIDGLKQKYKVFLKKVKTESTKNLDKSKYTRLSSGESYLVNKNWDILMAVKDKFLDSILKKGFLNMFQTGTGTYYKDNPKYYDNRKNAENDMVCMKLGKNWLIRPKYAFFMPYQKGIDRNKIDVRESYGNIFIHFKPEVKLRTTWTFGDSLNRWAAKDIYLPFSTDNATVRNLRGSEEYYEAQVYGELTKEDVFKVYTRGTPSKDLLNKLKKFGVEVWSFSGLIPHDEKILWNP